MRHVLTSLALALGVATSAAAQEGDSRIRVIAPGPGTSFLSLTWDGLVRRHGPTGSVLETLGRAAPFDEAAAPPRVQPAGERALVASTDLVRVGGGASVTVVSCATLRAEGCDRIADFAFDAEGRRGVLVATRNSGEERVLFAFADGALRRISALPMTQHVQVAMDANARWVAVLLERHGRMSSLHGGPLSVFDFATGRRLWELATCDGPQYGDAFHFAGETLVACRREAASDSRSGGVAAYDASTGRVRWSHDVGFVFARTLDGGTLLVESGRAGSPVRRLEVASGRLRSIGASWGRAPLGGLIVDGSRVVMLARSDRGPELIVAEIARAPWVE